MKKIIALAAAAATFGFINAASAEQVDGYKYCERVTLDTSGFTNYKAADSWYSKTTSFTIRDGEVTGFPSRFSVENFRYKSNGKRADFQLHFDSRYGDHVYFFKLLPNGKLLVSLGAKGGYKTTGDASYRCR